MSTKLISIDNIILAGRSARDSVEVLQQLAYALMDEVEALQIQLDEAQTDAKKWMALTHKREAEIEDIYRDQAGADI